MIAIYFPGVLAVCLGCTVLHAAIDDWQQVGGLMDMMNTPRKAVFAMPILLVLYVLIGPVLFAWDILRGFFKLAIWLARNEPMWE